MSYNILFMVKVEGLEKSFGKNAVLKGISTEIKRGEVVCIIGASGVENRSSRCAR